MHDLGFEQNKIDVSRSRAHTRRGNVDRDVVTCIQLPDQPVPLADRVGHQHFDVGALQNGVAADLGGSDHEHRAVRRQRMGELPSGGVAFERLDGIPRLCAGVRARQHPSRDPEQRTTRRPPFDELPTSGEQLDGIMRERCECDRGFAHERRRRDVAGPRDIPEPLDRVHNGDCIAPDVTRYAPRAVAFSPVVTAALDLDLHPLDGDARPLGEWLTTFPLVPVILDPYTHESAWLLDTSKRILEHFEEADCRVCWILKCSADDAKRFLGPYADEMLAFADESKAIVNTLGVEETPAILLLRQDGAVVAKAEGWDPDAWREVAIEIADLTSWSRPFVPAPGDPVPFSGTAV